MADHSPTTSTAALEARSNSVKQLCDLYRVVIAIAVGLAFHHLVGKYNSATLEADHVKRFVIFLMLVIPFFHGAVRHLFATYVEGGGSTRIKNWAILIDYYLLFLEGGIFVALSSSFDGGHTFFFVLLGVLGVDTVWGTLAVIGFAGSRSQKAEMKWALINFCTVSLLAFLYILHSYLDITPGDFLSLVLILVGVRTLVDYWWNLTFYCP